MDDAQAEQRFDRIETKIDRLTEVMANVARVEERLIGQDARLKRHERRLDETQKALKAIADETATNSFIAKVGTTLVATIWAGLVTTIMYFFRDQ